MSATPSDSPQDQPAGLPMMGDSATQGEQALTDAVSAVEAPGLEEALGLEESVELTPELLEDEAIRGDFVIRWAVVGLAILIGISPIATTETLGHLASGRQMLATGFLPTGEDQLALHFAAARWVNLNWGFDLLVASLWSLAGPAALSVFQGLLAATTFGLLVNAGVPGIRSWWGSICGALALLVCLPHLVVTPQLVTLVGVSLSVWLLSRWQQQHDIKFLWWWVPTLAVWANLDPRAELGWILLLVAVVFRPAGVPLRQVLGPLAAASLAIVLIHPFPLQSVWGLWNTYSIDYPAWRTVYPPSERLGLLEPDYFSIIHPDHFRLVDARLLIAGGLAIAALVCLVLNRRRAPLSHWVIWLASNSLAFVAVRELPVTALLNAFLANVNAQHWYLASFGQQYSTRGIEVAFSRMGRAVTVIAFCAVAWLMLSGRIDGPNGKRPGFGFAPHLVAAIDGYADLKDKLPNERCFNLAPRQGDLLIWTGHKPVIDSRLGLFSQLMVDDAEGASELVLHSATRDALRTRNRDGSPRPANNRWMPVFEKLGISIVMPRLSPTMLLGPDYASFDDLLSNQTWQLITVTGSTAPFYWKMTPDNSVGEFAKTRQQTFLQQAFTVEIPQLPTAEGAAEVVRPITTYQQWLSIPANAVGSGTLAASHWSRLAKLPAEIDLPSRIACATIAIRQAKRGLAQAPQAADAYLMAGECHAVLKTLERQLIDTGAVPLPLVRFYQSVVAFRNSLLISSNQPDVWLQLFEAYQSQNRFDLALDAIRQYLELAPLDISASDAALQARERLLAAKERLETITFEVVKRCDDSLKQGADRLNVASFAAANGCSAYAAQLLEGDQISLIGNPNAQLILADCRLDQGQLEAAADLVDVLERSAATPALMAPTRWLAGLVALCKEEVDRADRIWSQAVQEASSAKMETVLSTLPLAASIPVPDPVAQYPFPHLMAGYGLTRSFPAELANAEFGSILIAIETGRYDSAKQRLNTMLLRNPDSPWRPLVRLYLFCLGEPLISLEPELDQIPESTYLPSK